MNNSDKQKQYDRGRYYEGIASNMLARNGFCVSQTSTREKRPNGGAIATCKGKTFILPDIDCAYDGKRFFVEAKYKDSWYFWSVSGGGFMTTGVDTRLFEAYIDALNFMYADTIIMFFQGGFTHKKSKVETPKGIWYNSVSKLRDNVFSNDVITYWKQSDLIKLSDEIFDNGIVIGKEFIKCLS